jgi:hypothetical protein
MKDSLKDFITENREAFDDQEPSERIWSGISGSLPEKKTIPLWNSIHLWRVAAVILFGLSVFLFVTRQAGAPAHNQVAQSQREFSDLESFYRNEIAAKAKLINDFNAAGEGDHVTQDFKKLDAMYLVLSEELKSHPTEKVKDAMILNLLVRVDLLNQQLKGLEDSRNKKKSSGSAEV